MIADEMMNQSSQTAVKSMLVRNQILSLVLGLALGIGVGAFAAFQPRVAFAGNDRHENYVLCTGSAGVNPRSPLDGVWLLDYKSGKLLATIVDRTAGKATGFAEMDLVAEFGAKPNQNVHFVMTTGTISAGQSALYLAETTTGKFGIYTLGPAANGEPGVAILRHDLTSFRRKGE